MKRDEDFLRRLVVYFLELRKMARDYSGFKVHLYYVSTADPVRDSSASDVWISSV